jgi:undecaprenyl-diphosphatase
VLFLAIFLTFAIGVSRVYLGVHWPTDVLGGWTLGAAWALLCWVVALLLQQKKTVE